MSFRKLNNESIKIFLFMRHAFFRFLIITPICITFLINSPNKIIAKSIFCDIYIINNKNEKIKLRVEVADTYQTRTKGLMFRKKLDANTGMLFVFKDEKLRSFWMKNTYIPLSIAYVNRYGRINEIYIMKPLDTSVIYPSKKPALYAIEVNKGWFKKNNIVEGCRINFNGCISK